MKKKAFAGKILSGVLLFASLAPAQEAVGPNEKAKRYHTLLLKRPGNPTVFSRFVDAWLDTGEKKEMKAWLEKSAQSGGVAEWQVLAAFHEYSGEDEAALEAFNQAVEKDDKEASLRLARAKLHAKLLSFEAALMDLEVAAADEKLGVEASKLQGIYLARAGRIDEAVAAWKKVIERFPEDEELREDLIEVEVVEGLYDDAIAASQALVEMTKDPYKKALRQLRLGDIQILGSKREDGLKTYETIMAATGAGTWLEREVLAQVEKVFMREDDIQGLRDFFQKLREDHPQRVSVRKALARQMALNGEMDEAIELFREVLKITPGDVGNREEFIAFLETNERWKGAREELAELIKQREGDPLLWERMARIEEKLKNVEGVKAALAKVKDLKKESAEGVIAVAALFTQANLLAEAEALLREGRVGFPDSIELTEALASFLIQNEKEEEALKIWSVMAESADREGLLRVARSLTGHGKSDEGFKLLQNRMGEFGEDPLILAQFCALAFSEEEALVAMPFGLELVRRSTSPTDLEGAIRTAARVINRASKQEETLRELQARPDLDIPERCLVAELFAGQGDTLKALEILETAEKADEGLLARFYRVRFDENRGELDGAIASLREILELPDGRKTVHVRRLVGLLEKAGDFPGALKAVDDWKRMAPGDQAAWTRRAELLSQQGETDAAVLELRRMIGKFGAEEDSRARLAAALLEANEHRSAQRIYEQLYEEGEDLQVKLKWVGELAKVAKQEGTLEDLLADFERRKRENTNSVAPLLALAEIHHVLNRYDDRRAALLEASRRRPNDLKLLHFVADVEERAGELEKAVGTLKDAVRRDTTPDSKRKLAALYLKNGEFQAGLQLLQELPDEANDPRKIEATALSLLMKTEWDLAVQYLSGLRERHADDWRLQYLYALSLVMDGQEDEALKIYRGLFEVNHPIKGLKPVIDLKGAQGYWLRQLKSKVAMNGWAKLQRLEGLVTSEEENLRNLSNRGYSRYGSGHRYVNLPGNPEEVRMMSLLKASALVKKLPESEQEDVLNSFSIDGVERLDLFRLSRLDQKKLFEKVNELLESDPENPRFLHLWMNSRFSVKKEERKHPERIFKALEMTARQSPVDAVNLISGMFYQKEIEFAEGAALLTKYLESAKGGEDRTDILASILNIVNRFSVQAEDGEFEILGKALVAEAVATKKKPKDRSWMDQCLALAMNEGYQDEAIILLNRLSVWLREEKTAASLDPRNYSYGSFGRGLQVRSYSRSYGSSGGVLVVPEFPPKTIVGVHPFVAQHLARELGQSGVEDDQLLKRRLEMQSQLDPLVTNENETPVRVPEPLETFRGRTDEIESSLLRTLIESALGDEDAFARLVDEAGESKNLGHLKLASGYHWREKKQLKAYEILTRMRMLTLSRAERKEVDGQLAMVGSILTDEKDLEWDREPARRAAMRLRKLLTSANERTALLRILVKLGLRKEAEKMEAKPGINNRSSSSRRSASRATGRQSVINLVGDGRREEAAREAAKLFRQMSMNRSSSYEERRLLETLKKLDLIDLTLEKVHPKESRSVTRRMAYANLAISAEKPELARPIFEELLKERPDFIEARIGHFVTLPKEKRDYASFLKKDGEGKVDTSGMAEVMSKLWEHADDNYDEVIALLDLTSGLLNNLEPDSDEKRNLTWINYYLISSTQDVYYNGVQLGAYYTSRDGRTFDKEKTKVADEAFKKAFVGMLPHPQTAEQGFMMLLGAKENLKVTDEELVNYARLALAGILKRGKPDQSATAYGSNSLWILRTSNGTSSSYSLNGILSPLEFLISKESQDGILTPEMMTTLKENHPDRFESLVFAKKLAVMSPEEGLKALQDWYAGLKKGEGEDELSGEALSARVVELARDLMLFEFEPSLWTDELEKKLTSIRSTNWSDQTGWAAFSRKWLGWVARKKGEEGVKQFLSNLCEAQIGPKKQWPVLAELGYDFQPEDYRRACYQLSTKLQGFFAEEEVLRTLVGFTMEHNFDKVLPNFNVQGQVSSRIQNYRDPESLSAWLKKSNLLSSSSEGDADPAQLLGLLSLVERFSMSKSEDWKKLVETIKPLKLDPLFEAMIFLRTVSTEDRPKTLAGIWEDRVDLLRAMLKANESVARGKLKNWFPKFESPAAGPSLAAFLDELKSEQSQELREKGELWLAEGIEISTNDYQGRKLWAEISAIAEFDAILAGNLATKVLQKVQTDPALTRSRSSYSGINATPIDTWNQSFLEILVSRGGELDLFSKVKMIHTVYHGKLGSQLLELDAHSGNLTYYLQQAVTTKMETFKVEGESTRLKIQALFLEAVEELTIEEQATFVALIVPKLLRYQTFKSEELDSGMKWNDEILRPKSPIMADVVTFVMQTCAVSDLSSEKRGERYRIAGDTLADLLPRLKFSSPIAVTFAWGLMSTPSHGARLFAGPAQWDWLVKTMVEHSKGSRNIALSRAFEFFAHLQPQEFEGKIEASRKLMKALDGTMLTPELFLKFRNNSGRGSWVNHVLSLALTIDDKDLAKRLIQQNTQSFRGKLGTILHVAQFIDAATAARLMPATTSHYTIDNLPKYTKETTELSTRLMNVVPARDQFRLAVMIASLPDASDEESKPVETRSARLSRLAKRYPDEKPGDNGPRWQLLNIFASEVDAMKVLLPEFEIEAKKTSLAVAVALQSEGSRSFDGLALVQIIKRWLTEEMKAGRPEILLKEIGSLSDMAIGNDGYSFRYVGVELSNLLGGYLLQESSKSQERARELVALSRENLAYRLKMEPNGYDDPIKGLIWMDLFVHILAGETKAWYERAEELDEASKKPFAGPLSNSTSPTPFGSSRQNWGLRSVTGHGDYLAEENSPTRIAIVSAAFRDSLFLEKVMTYYTMPSTLMDATVIQKEELFKVIDALPNDHPRKAEFLMEKAGIIGWRDDKIAEAEKIYQEARKLALAQNNQKIVHLSNALHARLLGQKNRISESWKFGQLVDPAQLPEPDQKWFATDSVKWREAAAAKAAEAPKPPDTPQAAETKDPPIK